MSYRFSKTSEERLKTCHKDLQVIMFLSLQRSMIDFGIAEGHRSMKRQKALFDAGKSKIDGITKLGKHNYTPAMAVDIYPYVNGRTDYAERNLCYLAGVITSVAQELYGRGDVTHRIRWGGNWDGDGEIVTDQGFDDLVHFELV